MKRISFGQWVLDIGVILSYIMMVSANALANIIPINGVTTGEVSDSYFNLFAPAPITFAIWALIYLLLAIYVIYQMAVFHPRRRPLDQRFLNQVATAFIVSSLANTLWILAWHYRSIGWSLMLIAVVLMCLMLIVFTLNQMKLESSDIQWIYVPMLIYFGWMTIANIANATTYLVYMNWNRFEISEAIWMIVMLSIGVLLGSMTALRFKSLSYLSVLVWAYAGILLKHVSPSPGFDSMYQDVIMAVGVSLGLLILVGIKIILHKKKQLTAYRVIG